MLNTAKKLGLASALTIMSSFAANIASAATIATTAILPTAAVLNPTASATSGQVFQNVSNSISSLRRSPWQGTNSTVDFTDGDAWYSSVSAGASATYDFQTLQNSLSFVWGSPDTYNDLDIELIAGSNILSLNGSSMFPPGTQGANSAFVQISNVLFDRIVFRSGTNAFEYANLATSEVPVPAAAWLFGSALLGLAGVKSRNRKLN